MRRHALSVVAAASVVAGWLWVAPAAAAPADSTVERAVVTFHQPVRAMGKFLMGSYVIEHDEGRMARGEPCTHIYEGNDTAKPGRLVVSFDCVHRVRPVAAKTTVRLRHPADTLEYKQLSEFQYAGSAAGHGAPR